MKYNLELVCCVIGSIPISSCCVRSEYNDIDGQHDGCVLQSKTGVGGRETHSPTLFVQTWRLLLWCQDHKLIVSVKHLPGHKNALADRLSRYNKVLPSEWSLKQIVAHSLFHQLDPPMVDLFATRWNHKIPMYVSPVQDVRAWAI